MQVNIVLIFFFHLWMKIKNKLYFFIMRWIIDGYNVIFSDARLSKLLRNDVEAARDELIVEIQSRRSLTNDKVTLVFDGRYRATTDRISDNLTISFSTKGQTADDLIKEEIGRSTTRRSLCVVTNDLAIIDYARVCGANVTKSEEFLLMVRKFLPSHKGSRNDGKEKKEDSDAEKPAVIGKPDQELLKLFKENKK
jgi:predicted RNA-binding protein with PIN domain